MTRLRRFIARFLSTIVATYNDYNLLHKIPGRPCKKGLLEINASDSTEKKGFKWHYFS